jgi:acetolactate synthase-1/2/3 large subunit
MDFQASAPTSTLSPLSVGQALLRYLKLEGVDRVFGIPGGALGNMLVSIKDDRDLMFVVCRHETGAAYMADGYYRATRKLAVVLTTSGPGATNALTGAVNADNDGSAVLTITGEVARQFFGKGYLQEGVDANLDIDRIYSAATALSELISDPSDFQTLMERSLRSALSIPRRAAHISLPNDIPPLPLPQSFAVPTCPSDYRTVPRGVRDEDVCDALRVLLSHKKPLIFLGNGCRDALRDEETRNELARFAEHHAIPVATTADAKGIFPEGHPLSLRNYGFASCTWPRQWMAPESGHRYDCLLVIGSGLQGLATENWNPRMVPDGPVIQVDLQQQAIGRAFRLRHGVVGDAGAFIRRLGALDSQLPTDSTQVGERRKIVEDIKCSSPFLYPREYESNAAPIRPSALVRVLQKTLPRKTMVFLDGGNCVAWGVNCFIIDPPWECHSSLDMGPMGFAVGAVIGAKMGQPEYTCVALVGDGAFLMHGAEVSTAQAHGVGAIWVVLQDNDLHMVTQGQEYFFPDSHNPKVWQGMFRLGKPDLTLFARGLGADAHTVQSPADLERIMPQVVAGAYGNRPQVVIAAIDQQSFSPYFAPPLPPHGGQGVPRFSEA